MNYRIRALVLAMTLLVLAAACSEGADDTADADFDAVEEAAHPPVGDDAPAGDTAEQGAPPAESADAGDAVEALPTGDRARDGRHVILDGRMTVAYPSTFDDAFRAVADVSETLGGGVSGVQSETTEEGVVVGEVTVRVPVDSYDALLIAVADLGPVVDRLVTEEDVSGEVVDLRSRLRHLERQETFYLGLLDEAEEISDAITIQEHLARVQQRKEEVQGRLDHLEDRTSMSTLRVRLVPEGHEADGLDPQAAGFDGYWDDAVTAFVRVTGTLLVIAVGGAPLLVLAAVALGVIVVLVRALAVKGGSGGQGPVASGSHASDPPVA